MTNQETAFPCFNGRKEIGVIIGLTKREWFAGMALQGVLAGRKGIMITVQIAEQSFEIADAMIEASKG